MAFINEKIPMDDIKKYGLNEINRRYAWGELVWTVDRDRDIYLRQVRAGREEFSHESTWNLYWGGELLEVDIAIKDAGGTPRGECWAHKKVQRIQVPPHLASKRDEILADLKEALTAYKDGGVFATSSSYRLIFEV
jgi:hypothetical protein